MGSPNNIDVVTGAARIPHKEISAAEWCKIMEHALFRIKPCLKYMAGFKTLAKLLNGELMPSHGQFITPSEAMPNFEGTRLSQRTRFVALDMWCIPSKNAGTESSHEFKRGVLLLADTGDIAILELSYFKQSKHYIVCATFLTDTSSMDGHKSVLNFGSKEIRDYIANESISPFNMIDRLYLLFYNNVADGEKHLDSKRQARDILKQMCDRVAI